jgi:hypothetical protein
MKRRRRFSYEQLRTLWTLWKDGHTLPQIQAALGVSLTGVVRAARHHHADETSCAPRPGRR